MIYRNGWLKQTRLRDASLGQVSMATQGLALFSMPTLAAEAKILVTSLSSWIMIRACVHLQQGMMARAAVGWPMGDSAVSSRHRRGNEVVAWRMTNN